MNVILSGGILRGREFAESKDSRPPTDLRNFFFLLTVQREKPNSLSQRGCSPISTTDRDVGDDKL